MTSQLAQTGEWEPLPDGRYHRNAARAVIFDCEGNVLLLSGHDINAPETHRWWFTVGGGINSGETSRLAACREVAEETGWQVQPTQLVGPVLLRHSEFRFVSNRCLQDETFYLLNLTDLRPPINMDNFTEIERQTISEARWWSQAELATAAKSGTPVVYPLQLGCYAQQWFQGWDGSCPSISEGTIPPRGGWE